MLLLSGLILTTISNSADPAGAAEGLPYSLCNQQMPAASNPGGTSFTFVTPASGHYVEVIAFRAQVTTSAVAGTRTVEFRVWDNFLSAPWWQVAATQTAGQTINYSGQQGAGSAGAAAVGSNVNLPLPQGLTFTTPFRFQMVIQGAQAGDTIAYQSSAYCDATSSTLPVSVSNTVPISGTVTVGNTVAVSGASFTDSTACPYNGHATTTTTAGPSTTTTTQPQQPCPVTVAGFTEDGLAVPVALGLVSFALPVMIFLGWRYRASR